MFRIPLAGASMRQIPSSLAEIDSLPCLTLGSISLFWNSSLVSFFISVSHGQPDWQCVKQSSGPGTSPSVMVSGRAERLAEIPGTLEETQSLKIYIAYLCKPSPGKWLSRQYVLVHCPVIHKKLKDDSHHLQAYLECMPRGMVGIQFPIVTWTTASTPSLTCFRNTCVTVGP